MRSCVSRCAHKLENWKPFGGDDNVNAATWTRGRWSRVLVLGLGVGVTRREHTSLSSHRV